MLLKLGVDISRLSDPARRALSIVDNVWKSAGIEAVITSTYEGTHSPSSLHYQNRAFDIRLPGKDGVVAKLKEDLGPSFDVITEGDHIHVEHDPK